MYLLNKEIIKFLVDIELNIENVYYEYILFVLFIMVKTDRNAEYSYNHCVQRAKERYNIILTKQLYDEMNKRVKKYIYGLNKDRITTFLPLIIDKYK